MTQQKRLISILLSVALMLSTLALFTDTADAATYTGKYWLKINEQRNVITAYKKVDGRWKPIRAMLCSTGLNGATPKGTFYTQGKWRWGELMNDVYGQYCTHITDDILFHSVYYKKPYEPSTQFTNAFNLLGSSASHGCVRVSVMDAKWIYERCKVGTKITIYRSSISGPLGKPAPTKVWNRGYYWDPTDPNPANPYFIMRRPVISVSAKKSTAVQYGSNYNLKSYVYAKDPNTFMSLKDYIKVSKVQRYSSSKARYESTSFSTKKLGTYKVTYYVKDPYGKSASTTLKIKVVDNLKAPVISGAKSKTVGIGDSDAVGNLTAKQASADRAKALTVNIKAPGKTSYKAYTYSQAKTYVFDQPGKYFIRYTVKNKYAPYKAANKTITVSCLSGEENKPPTLAVPNEKTLSVGSVDASLGASAFHNGQDVSSSISVSILTPGSKEAVSYTFDNAKTFVFEQIGAYTITYTIKNMYMPYQLVKKTVKVQVQ